MWLQARTSSTCKKIHTYYACTHTVWVWRLPQILRNPTLCSQYSKKLTCVSVKYPWTDILCSYDHFFVCKSRHSGGYQILESWFSKTETWLLFNFIWLQETRSKKHNLEVLIISVVTPVAEIFSVHFLFVCVLVTLTIGALSIDSTDVSLFSLSLFLSDTFRQSLQNSQVFTFLSVYLHLLAVDGNCYCRVHCMSFLNFRTMTDRGTRECRC